MLSPALRCFILDWLLWKSSAVSFCFLDPKSAVLMRTSPQKIFVNALFDSLLFMGATNFCLLIWSALSFNQSRCLILLVVEVFVFSEQDAFSLIGSPWNKLWTFEINSINFDFFIQGTCDCLRKNILYNNCPASERVVIQLCPFFIK